MDTYDARLEVRPTGPERLGSDRWVATFRSADIAQAFVEAAGTVLSQFRRQWITERMAERYKPIVAQLHTDLGEGWHVTVEDTGGGFTVIACYPVDPANPGVWGATTGKPYVWIDDQFADRPQAGFYDGGDDWDSDEGHMMFLTDRANYEFGDDPAEDRSMIRNLTGMMRTLIENMAHAWAFKSSQPEEPVFVVTVTDTNRYDYLIEAGDRESAINKVRTLVEKYGIEAEEVDGNTTYDAEEMA